MPARTVVEREKAKALAAIVKYSALSSRPPASLRAQLLRTLFTCRGKKKMNESNGEARRIEKSGPFGELCDVRARSRDEFYKSQRISQRITASELAKLQTVTG